MAAAVCEVPHWSRPRRPYPQDAAPLTFRYVQYTPLCRFFAIRINNNSIEGLSRYVAKQISSRVLPVGAPSSRWLFGKNCYCVSLTVCFDVGVACLCLWWSRNRYRLVRALIHNACFQLISHEYTKLFPFAPFQPPLSLHTISSLTSTPLPPPKVCMINQHGWIIKFSPAAVFIHLFC